MSWTRNFAMFFMAFLLLLSHVDAQFGINTDGTSPDSSAMLDVKSATKGFLPPRVALIAINSAAPVTNPATGLLVFNTANAGTPPNNVIVGYYFWNGTKWISFASQQGTNAGDMLYWDGTNWVLIPSGSYGQQLFLCNGVPTWGGCMPLLTTTTVTNIAQSTATSGGNINNDGGTPVTARGVCWSTSANPTTANSHTTDGAGTGAFVSNITGLTGNTLYYVRAYATNSVGTSYGNQVSFTTLAGFYIGQSYGGGVIFYIDGTGQHGLISATTDQSAGAEWGCYGTLIGANGTAIGTGQANTTAIVNGCNNAGIAASICNDLVLNGYDDWFLPSKDELNEMYLQRNHIGSFANNYWSSSEYNLYSAWLEAFVDGYQSYNLKVYTFFVRAIRAF